jgi:hypothetical protein
MREGEFLKFLSSDKAIKSKEKAVRSRVSKAKQVEDKLNINLDVLVKNDDDTYNALLRLKNDFHDQHGVLQNAVRKYYIFVNDKKFPTLKNYKK